MERNRADHMGMLAQFMNGIALCDALLRAGVDAKVMSAVDMQRFCDTYSAREAHAALDKNNIDIHLWKRFTVFHDEYSISVAL